MEGDFDAKRFVSENLFPLKNAGKDKQEGLEKYKTELCRNWAQGSCAYGKNCIFAHGQTDKRNRSTHQNYKTKFCENILKEGYCPYGSRCKFQHYEDIDSSPAKTRLPVFVDIEKRSKDY